MKYLTLFSKNIRVHTNYMPCMLAHIYYMAEVYIDINIYFLCSISFSDPVRLAVRAVDGKLTDIVQSYSHCIMEKLARF